MHSVGEAWARLGQKREVNVMEKWYPTDRQMDKHTDQ